MYDFTFLVAVIISLTELTKRVTPLRKKFLPLIPLSLGIIASILYVDGIWQDKLMIGVILGLSAAGLFDQSKILDRTSEEEERR